MYQSNLAISFNSLRITVVFYFFLRPEQSGCIGFFCLFFFFLTFEDKKQQKMMERKLTAAISVNESVQSRVKGQSEVSQEQIQMRGFCCSYTVVASLTGANAFKNGVTVIYCNCILSFSAVKILFCGDITEAKWDVGIKFVSWVVIPLAV